MSCAYVISNGKFKNSYLLTFLRNSCDLFSFVCLDNLYKVHRCAWIRDSDYDVTIVITENACPQNLHGEYFHLWQWSRSNSDNERKQRTAMVLTNKRKKISRK